MDVDRQGIEKESEQSNLFRDGDALSLFCKDLRHSKCEYYLT